MRYPALLVALVLSAATAHAQSRVACDSFGNCSGTVDGQNYDSSHNGPGARSGAQGARQYESQTDMFGNTTGTIGNRNFQIDGGSDGRRSGQIGGQRLNNRSVRPSSTPGNVGATQSRCYQDGNGNTFCQ